MASCFPVFPAAAIFLLTGLVASQTTPGCSSNECERPTTGGGLSITNDKPCYASDEKLTYVCTGTSFGPSENICDGPSGWRYDHPVCKESDISCPSINTPPNGIISNKRDNYTIYQAVDIACKAGYTLVGASRKVCDIDGNFKPLYDPICTETLSVPQTTRPSSPVMTTGPDVTSASSVSTISGLPSSTEQSTEPTSEKKTEPPASSSNPPEDNWNGLIIGLCAGIGGGILLVVVVLILSNCHSKHSKKGIIEPGEKLEMNRNEYQLASTNKSFSETWG